MGVTTAPDRFAGRYRLGDPLGAGGMGQVWLARDDVLDRDVAIKEIALPTDLSDHERESARHRTLREARAAARLNHPNVVQVYDVISADGRIWIVMEHVPSRSLQEVIQTDGPLEPRYVAAIGLAVLAALDAAHRAGVRHRDVKPANVLLADDGRVMLTDFGIASIDGDSIITSSDLVLGSPQYMAPERVRHGQALAASDLWSLGATLYAAVEGQSPYERPSAMATLTALAVEEPDPPRRAGPLQPVLEGLLRKDPAARIGVAEAERRLLSVATGVPAEQLGRPAEQAPPTPVEAERTTDAEPQPAATTDTSDRAAAPSEPEAAPSRGRAAGRRPALVVAVTAAVVTAAVAAWLAIAPGRTHTDGSAARPTATATTPSAAPSTAPAPGGTAVESGPSGGPPASAAPRTGGPTARPRPALPAGWRDYHDPTGFRVYVPQGWTKSQKGSIVYFRNFRTGRVLGIDQTDKPQWNPVADWRGKADYRVRRGDFPGYHEIRIVAVPYFRKAADWEYTFDGRSARQHVNHRGFIVSNTQAYGIYWQTRDADWVAARTDLQLVFASFRPATD
jgi:hypothetical protein